MAPNFLIASERTLCFLIRDEKISLGMKKTGQGAGNYNGYGGGVLPGETVEECALREIREETNLTITKEQLKKTGTIDFHFPYKPEWNQRVHLYVIRSWKGEPEETSEMRPEWFSLNNIPYDTMWDSDKIWLPKLLSGQKIEATFVWKDDNKTVDSYKL